MKNFLNKLFKRNSDKDRDKDEIFELKKQMEDLNSKVNKLKKYMKKHYEETQSIINNKQKTKTRK